MESLDYPQVKQHNPVVISFESIPTSDRQMDRKTNGRRDTLISKSFAGMAERDKNRWPYILLKKSHTVIVSQTCHLTTSCLVSNLSHVFLCVC